MPLPALASDKLKPASRSGQKGSMAHLQKDKDLLRMFLDSRLWTWLSLNREKEEIREKLIVGFQETKNSVDFTVSSVFPTLRGYSHCLLQVQPEDPRLTAPTLPRAIQHGVEPHPNFVQNCWPRGICMSHLLLQIPHPPKPTAHPPPFHSRSLAKLCLWWLCFLGQIDASAFLCDFGLLHQADQIYSLHT